MAAELSPNLLKWLLYCTCVVMMSYPVVVEAQVKNYLVEVRVFVDKKGHDLWKKKSGMTSEDQLRKEITSYFVDVTDMYESLVKPINSRFKFAVDSIILLDKDILEAKHLKSYESVTFLSKWVPENYAKKVDMNILFTGFNLEGAVGWGYKKGICTTNSSAVMEYSATPRDIQILAHEIGHVLGAEHDYEKDSKHDCYKDNGKIMNPNIDSTPNSNNYKFSYCTGSWVRERIMTMDKEGTNCLKDGTNPVSGLRFGELVSLDNICRRAVSRKTGFVRSSYYGRNPAQHEDMCLRLRCSAQYYKLGYDKTARFPQGAKCGKNKVCLKGKCVPSPNVSPTTLDICPFGDQQKITWLNTYNRECTALSPKTECEKHKYECCYTCNKDNPYLTRTADEVCTELFGKGFVLKRFAYSEKDYENKICSELICVKNVPGTGRVTKTSTMVPDGLACKPAWSRCNKGTCVDSNYRIKMKPSREGCPFGDQDLKSLGFPHSCQESRNSCKKSTKLACCMTCRGR